MEDLLHKRHRIVPYGTDPTNIHDPTVAGRIEEETRARHTARRGVVAVSREREKDARCGRWGIFFIHFPAETEGGGLEFEGGVEGAGRWAVTRMLEGWGGWKGEGVRGASMEEVRWGGILTVLG